MGKRRIRNLQTLSYKDIVGFDVRQDRCQEAHEKYGIKIVDDLNEAIKKVDAVIISTPPNSHRIDIVSTAVENGKPCFMELNVFDWGINKVAQMAKEADVLVAPSCTLRYYSTVKKMKKIIESHELGKPLAFTCHAGQYLLNWHPWEGLNFYMSDKQMGGALEVASFDLVWITWLFGYPVWQHGTLDKVSDLEADIYDICHLIMGFEPKIIGHLMTDVVSRVNERVARIFCEEGVIIWDWGEGLRIATACKDANLWHKYSPRESLVQEGYSNKIKEEPYIEEISTFINAAKGETEYPYTLEEVEKRLRILEILKEAQK